MPKFKQQCKHYGKLHLTSHDPHPWQTICVDLYGSVTFLTLMQSKSHKTSDHDGKNTDDDKTLQLLALTIINPDTSWIEIITLPDKESKTIALAFDKQWLSCYPRLIKCIHDKESKFVGFEFQELLESNGIKSHVTTIGIPQGNTIL